MTPQQLAHIDDYAQQVANATPAPTPALAAKLRALLNPHELEDRLARLQADPAYLAALAEDQEIRSTKEYRGERKRLAANPGHYASLPEPPNRNRGHFPTDESLSPCEDS